MTDQEHCFTDAELEDVAALAEMMRSFFAPLAEEPIPQEALEGLARDLVAHNGEEGFDAQAVIDSWMGDYVDGPSLPA